MKYFEQLQLDTDAVVNGRRTRSAGDTVLTMTAEDEPDVGQSQARQDGLDAIEEDARQRLEDAKKQIAVLNAQARIFSDVADVTAKVRAAQSGGRFGVVAFELTALQRRLADHGQTLPPELGEALEVARGVVSGGRDGIVDGIRAESLGADFSFQAGTRYPSLALEDGFYMLEFDADALVITLRTRYGRKAGLALPWDIETVVGALKAERQRCFPAKPNLKALAAATVKLAKKAPEGRVPVDEVFAELQKGKIVGARDEFAVLLRDGSLAGTVALEHARNPSDGLLLPGLETQGRFGYVGVASPN